MLLKIDFPLQFETRSIFVGPKQTLAPQLPTESIGFSATQAGAVSIQTPARLAAPSLEIPLI